MMLMELNAPQPFRTCLERRPVGPLYIAALQGTKAKKGKRVSLTSYAQLRAMQRTDRDDYR